MAAADYFLKLEAVPGESQDKKHKDEIEILSFSFGESQTGTMAFGGGGGSGKVSMHDFSFTKKIDKSSPKLFLMCAKGEHISKGTLTCRKAGGEQQEYLKVILTDVMVSNFQTGGAGGADPIPTESISLNFSKIDWEYKAQDEKGKLGGAVTASYSLKENVGK
jgi:type VI secretion system secreted protein Hcp